MSFLSPDGKKFLKRGGQLSTALFFSGLTGLIFSSALINVNPVIVSAFGISLSLYLWIVTPFLGFRIFIVSKASDKMQNGLFEAALLATLFGFCLYAIFAYIFIFNYENPYKELLSTYIFIQALSIPMSVICAILSGLLVRQGNEKILATTTFHIIVLEVLFVIWIVVGPLPDDKILIELIGIQGVISSIYMMIRYLGALDINGWQSFQKLSFRTKKFYWRQGFGIIKQVVAGASDVIILSSSFFILLSLIAHVDPGTAAVTTLGIAIVRTFVIPLKSFGTVGGRILLNQKDPIKTAQLDREFFYLIVWGCTGISGIFALLALLLPSLGPMFSKQFTTQGGQWVLLAIAIQFLLEPWAGFRSAALKITITPAATLPQLAIALWGIVLPVGFLLFHVGHLNIFTLWILLLSGRLIFLLLIQFSSKSGYIYPIQKISTNS